MQDDMVERLMNKNYSVCYTCIVGDYDYLRPIERITKGWDYKAFVTSDVDVSKGSGWDIVIIDREDFEGLSDTKISRSVKIEPHEVFSKKGITIPKYTIWVDGRITIRCDINQFRNMLIGGVDFVTLDHPSRDCVYQEIEACRKMNKEGLGILDQVRDRLIYEAYPKNIGMIQSGVLIREHGMSVNIFCSKWMDQVRRFSSRDQISFNYIKHNNQSLIRHKTISSTRYLNEKYLHLGNHSHSEINKRMLRMLNED